MHAIHRLIALSVAALLVTASVASSQSAPSKLPGHDGFHVVLLSGSNAAGGKIQGPLPAGVEKALKDASQFLPFTSYALEDQAVVHGTGSRATVRLQSQVGGARDYTLSVNTRPSESGGDRVSVAVVLVDKTWPNEAGREVLSTDYSARLGETVLVGTSKVKGQVSLVLLLTMLPPNAKTPGTGQPVE